MRPGIECFIEITALTSPPVLMIKMVKCILSFTKANKVQGSGLLVMHAEHRHIIMLVL